MLSQLHSVFTTHTLIERELSNLIMSGVVRKLLLRGSSADGRGGEVTGAGGDVGLLLSSTYASLLSPHATSLPEFTNWINSSGRTGVSISHNTLVSQGVIAEEIKKAVELGFLIIDYSIREAGYMLSVPGAGRFIRNLRGGRRELLRSLKRQKYKEMLEKVYTPLHVPDFRI
jgi:Serine-threonine protein kinase 19